VSYLAEIMASVVRYDPGRHKAQLREFQRTYFGANARQGDDAFESWLFLRNPHRDPRGPSFWLSIRDGAVVGQIASIEARLKVGDAHRRGGWMIDWMAHPAWRLKGVAHALFSAYARDTEVMLGLGIEDLAYRTAARAGWKDVGRLTLYVRPLDTAACAAVLNLPAMLGKLAPRALVAGSASLAGKSARALARVRMEPVAVFDERVGALWARAKADYPVLVVRDFAAVRWRFDDGPQRTQYERYYFFRGGEVVGYAVLRMAAWRGHRVGRVVEYFGERRHLVPMLAQIIEAFAAKGVIAVFFEQCHAGSDRALRALGCLGVRAEHRKRFMIGEREAAAQADPLLYDGSSWFIMPADGDFDHILLADQTQG
jgi:hypothetical protein